MVHYVGFPPCFSVKNCSSGTLNFCSVSKLFNCNFAQWIDLCRSIFVSVILFKSSCSYRFCSSDTEVPVHPNWPINSWTNTWSKKLTSMYAYSEMVIVNTVSGQANRSQVNKVSVEQYILWTKCLLNKCAVAISQLNNVTIEPNLPQIQAIGVRVAINFYTARIGDLAKGSWDQSQATINHKGRL